MTHIRKKNLTSKNFNSHSHSHSLFPLLLLIFIDSFSFFFVIPVLLKIFYHAQYGLLPHIAPISVRNELTGITISLSMMAALFAAPFIGKLSDKYGRKKILLVCTGAVFLGFLLPIIGIVQKNIFFILLGRVISGIGSASQPVAQAAVVDICKKENKAIYLSLIAVMMTVALIVAPIAGGFFTDSHIESGFTILTPFEFACILSIFNFLFIIIFFKETLKENSKSEIASLFQVIRALPVLIKKYRIGILILFFCCLELGWSQYYQSISLFLQLKLHENIEKISLFNTNMGVVMAIGLLIIYPLLLRWVELKTIMRFSMFFVFIGLIACALFPFSLIQWIFSSVIALCTGFAYVSIVALISNQVSQKEQGILMGYLSAVLYCCWMITSFSSGFLISVFSTLPIYCAAGFLLVSLKSLLR